MTDITSIELLIGTGSMEDAGTDGDVYLGVCGREFFADTDNDDFERESGRRYIFGEGANVRNQSDNDPRSQQLVLENVERLPVYIRFQPKNSDDRWNLAGASVSFNGQPFPLWETASFLKREVGIWLGRRAGLYVYLGKHQDLGVQRDPVG